MKTRKLGRTDLRVSEIGFGGGAVGGNVFGNSYGDTDDAVSRAVQQSLGRLRRETLARRRTDFGAGGFALDDPAVESVAVSAKTPAQVEENVGAVSVSPIDDGERERVAGVFE